MRLREGVSEEQRGYLKGLIAAEIQALELLKRRMVTCACGKRKKRTSMTCLACKHASQIKVRTPCACGAVISPQASACWACLVSARRAEGITVRQRICAHCGERFTRPRNGSAGKYCSRECAFTDPALNASKAAHLERLRWTSRLRALERRAVRRAVSSMRPMARVLAEDARRRAYAEQLRREQAERMVVRMALAPVACKACGSSFVPVNRLKCYCSEACARRTRKRVAKGVRRARSRGVHSESVDPMKVCARDGWRCRICGRRTPRSSRGLMVPNAPEMDHIVPLALGGSHSYQNTQCACRQCNGRKGANVQGQLRLC